MFDMGFTELIVIGIVALLVVGPEKLPATIRTTSLWIGRLRRSFASAKSEIEQQINADEIRRQLHNESIMADLEKAKKKANNLVKDTEDSVKKAEKEILDPGRPWPGKASDETKQPTDGAPERPLGEQSDRDAHEPVNSQGANPEVASSQGANPEVKSSIQYPGESAAKRQAATPRPTPTNEPKASKESKGATEVAQDTTKDETGAGTDRDRHDAS